MKIKLLLILPIFIFAFNIKEEYISQNYKDVCLYGINHLQNIKKDENMLSLIGISCVKSDYFIYLPAIINNLKYSKQARKNSIYFSLLFVEKKLLYSYMLDHTDLSFYRFPLIKHPISIVLNNIIKNNFTKINNKIVVNYKNIIYKIYMGNENKMFIDVYKNNNLIQRHWYR